MAPYQPIAIREKPSDHPSWDGSWKYGLTIEGFIIEAWSQGFMVGALIIMAGLTISNMRRKLLLHKLILIELILAMFHGTFCFMDFEGYGWYVSSTAVCLYSSWYLHNIVAWIKIKPFLRRDYSYIYIISFVCTTPYWILEAYGNYAFNNNIDRLFLRTRPFEALCRDPWWIFTAVNLLYNIKKRYNFEYITLIRTSPRFGVMLVSMFLSIVFLIVDVLSAVDLLGETPGINPYWKLSLVFKCFCDTIILDDFRSALEKIRSHYFNRIDHDHDPNEDHRLGRVPTGRSDTLREWPHEQSKAIDAAYNTRNTNTVLSSAGSHGGSSTKKSLPSVLMPKMSARDKLDIRPGRNRERIARSGLFKGLFFSREEREVDEDMNRIHVNTDITTDRQDREDLERGENGGSRKSSVKDVDKL